LRRLTPGLLGVGVYYIDVIIGRRLLSDLGEGAVTYFSYALRLCDFSQGIFIMALSAATLPSLAAFAARGQLDEVGKTFAYSMRHALFIGVAATGATVVLAEPLVSLLLQHGAFDAAAVRETSRALIAQGVSIFLVAGVRQLVLVYFALGQTRSPVRVALVDLVVFFAVSILLRDRVGHVGVSWGVTAARVVQFSLLFWGLKGKLPSTHAREIGQSALRSLLAALPALVLTWLVLAALGAHPAGPLWSRTIPVLVGGGTFMATFVAAAVLLRCDELSTASRPLVQRWQRLTGSR
jgi:putative peptidoglycan lipid II flippase